MGRYKPPQYFSDIEFSPYWQNVRSDRIPPDLFHILPNYLTTSKTLVDINVGNGERLKKVAHLVDPAYGIATHLEDAITANHCVDHWANILVGNAEMLPFHDASMHVVVCRHAAFNATEIWRVLKPSGIFLTQQIAEDDKRNLKAILGRSYGSTEDTGRLQRQYEGELRAVGFEVKSEAYTYQETYGDMDTLIHVLANTMTIPDFDVERDEQALHQIETSLMATDGIPTTASRFLLIATKPRRT